jgi:hypothetical protein
MRKEMSFDDPTHCDERMQLVRLIPNLEGCRLRSGRCVGARSAFLRRRPFLGRRLFQMRLQRLVKLLGGLHVFQCRRQL